MESAYDRIVANPRFGVAEDLTDVAPELQPEGNAFDQFDSLSAQ